MDLRQKDKEKAKEKEKEVAPGDRTPKDQKWTVVREKHHEDRGHGKMCGDWVDSENCELRMVLVKPRSREGSVSERLCNVWLDDARDELVIVYETIKKLCVGSHNLRFEHDLVQFRREAKFGRYSVRMCPSAHTERPWLSISTHISTLVLGLSTLALPVDCSGDFGPRGLSVQYTQDVRWCPPAHTGRPWLSVCVRVCPSAHIGCYWLSISTHISTLVHGLSTLALPMDCSGDFGPRGLSVQYTQDVHVCPSAHTGCPCVSVSTNWTSVAVRQHTQNFRGCPSVHISERWPFP
ncbi:hypothetical protein IGI04_036049 [Brassica rapa subsp. trilocularis]|uniref:Uncharacterized protein n=1 Tax=Brassica rapa subsp. trilocularis TaxID=1813537 RepID=A0ABQ7LDF6_BRACM|nr:hypothetical protein IGI04_036049 [Brassica rapa subsp. trilocularis]